MFRIIARLAPRLGVPAWLLTTGLVLILAGAAWLAWAIWLADHDQDLISAHENDLAAQVEGQGRVADQNLVGRAEADRAHETPAREEFNDATCALSSIRPY